MNTSIQVIPVFNLALSFIPVIIVIVIHHQWTQGHRNSLYAVSRMLLQLLMIGYFLASGNHGLCGQLDRPAHGQG
jgi:putative ABC transport system permease protein